MRAANRGMGGGMLVLALAIVFAIADARSAVAFEVFASGLNNPRGRGHIVPTALAHDDR
jgi:hypothetical protein